VLSALNELVRAAAQQELSQQGGQRSALAIAVVDQFDTRLLFELLVDAERPQVIYI